MGSLGSLCQKNVMWVAGVAKLVVRFLEPHAQQAWGWVA